MKINDVSNIKEQIKGSYNLLISILIVAGIGLAGVGVYNISSFAMWDLKDPWSAFLFCLPGAFIGLILKYNQIFASGVLKNVCRFLGVTFQIVGFVGFIVGFMMVYVVEDIPETWVQEWRWALFLGSLALEISIIEIIADLVSRLVRKQNDPAYNKYWENADPSGLEDKLDQEVRKRAIFKAEREHLLHKRSQSAMFSRSLIKFDFEEHLEEQTRHAEVTRELSSLKDKLVASETGLITLEGAQDVADEELEELKLKHATLANQVAEEKAFRKHVTTFKSHS